MVRDANHFHHFEDGVGYCVLLIATSSSFYFQHIYWYYYTTIVGHFYWMWYHQTNWPWSLLQFSFPISIICIIQDTTTKLQINLVNTKLIAPSQPSHRPTMHSLSHYVASLLCLIAAITRCSFHVPSFPILVYLVNFNVVQLGVRILVVLMQWFFV